MKKILMSGQTPNFSEPGLCVTCRWAHNMKGRGIDDDMTFCRAGHWEPFHIKHPLVSCSEYDDKRVPSLNDMEKIAYRLSVDNGQKFVGFLTPKKYKEKFGDDD